MFGLRAPELIIILVVVLIIFGPKNLPKLGKSLGSTVKNIREGMEGDDKAETKQAEEVVVEQSEEDKEIAELEAKLAAAKKKQYLGSSEYRADFAGTASGRYTEIQR